MKSICSMAFARMRTIGSLFSPVIIVLFLFVASLFGFFLWRTTVPSNRYQSTVGWGTVTTDNVPYLIPHTKPSYYENIVSQLTAHHFSKDGFRRTHFLPNRGGAPIVSIGDHTKTICEPLAAPKNIFIYRDDKGDPVDVISANNDCIYTHYPPLSDWIFGAMARLGLDEYHHYKTAAVFANCALLVLFFFWLKKRTHPTAAFIAVAVGGTLPVFLEWSDTLMYHAFHFLALMAGIWAWDLYLEKRRRLWLAATWLCYLGESLLSYQLTFFFTIALLGFAILHCRFNRAMLKPFLLVLSAPIVAFAGHLSLIISLFGIRRTGQNLFDTYIARTAQLKEGGFAMLIDWTDKTLIPIWLLFGLFGAMMGLSVKLKRPLRERTLLLTVFFAGGISFAMAFPGTTSSHSLMMHRLLMPFEILLVAFSADTLIEGIQAMRLSMNRKSVDWKLIAGATALLFCFVAVFQNNADYLSTDLEWIRKRNRHYNIDNLVGRSLDVVYWSEDSSVHHYGLVETPILGMIEKEPPGWQIDFRFTGTQPSHYEIWWLEPLEMRSVRLLLDEENVSIIKDNCYFSVLHDAEFHRLTLADSAASPYAPPDDVDLAERRYSWLTHTLSTPAISRSLRLTCRGVADIALRQIEVFEDQPNEVTLMSRNDSNERSRVGTW